MALGATLEALGPWEMDLDPLYPSQLLPASFPKLFLSSPLASLTFPALSP